MPIQLRYLDVKLRKISLFKAPGHLLTDVSLSPCWKTHLTESISHVFAIGILCDLPWQWHVEWSLHWLSLLVTSCGGSLGPHQPYKGCVKKENCMVYVLTVTVVERWKPLWISLCLLCNRGWVCSLSWSSEARAQTRSRKVKDGEGWIEQIQRKIVRNSDL